MVRLMITLIQFDLLQYSQSSLTQEYLSSLTSRSVLQSSSCYHFTARSNSSPAADQIKGSITDNEGE
ncbi:hypothetical protein PAMP_011060 [Pampus punctatissimus]